MSYLDTLRRIPNDIFLDIFARDFDERSGSTCICGWALRDRLAELTGAPPELVDLANDYGRVSVQAWRPIYERCAAQFGGTPAEWYDLYWNAASFVEREHVEEAVVDHLNEIIP